MNFSGDGIRLGGSRELAADRLEAGSTTRLGAKTWSQTYYNRITGIFDWVESGAQLKRPISVATTPWIGW
jgi:hypothetical protein